MRAPGATAVRSPNLGALADDDVVPDDAGGADIRLVGDIDASR